MRILDGLDLSNQQLKNLADGSAATDAVNLQQMQAFVRGLDWKASAVACSSSDVDLAAPGISIDGVPLAVADRVLLRNQTAPEENGLYAWTGAASPLTRTTDADATTMTAGTAVLVTAGTVDHDTAWVLQTDDPIVVDTTPLTFAQFGGASPPYTAGNGIDVTANVVSVKAVAGGGILVVAGGVEVDFSKAATKFSTNVGDGTSSTIVVNHGLGTTDIQPVLREIATKEIVGIKFTVTDVNNLTMNFPSAPTSAQYRITCLG